MSDENGLVASRTTAAKDEIKNLSGFLARRFTTLCLVTC